MDLIVPQRLSTNSKIAAITLSWWWPWAFPHRYQAGKKQLEETFWVRVVEMPNTLKNPDFIYHNPKERARDLMLAFEDKTIEWIISTIWWDESIRLLPYINYETIKNNPKIFMWYSDSTITNFICYKAGIRSYYWPAIMAWFGENWWIFEYMKDSVQKTLFSGQKIWEIKPNQWWWTDEILEWSNPDNQSRKRKLNKSSWWRFLQGEWIVKWKLLWGLIETFPFMRGTEIRPDKNEWKDKILFIETSEERIDDIEFERIIRTLWAQWILANINWIIMWRAQENKNYDDALLKIINTELHLNNLPIITWMNFGHTDPMFILPIWAQMTLDMKAQKIYIDEAWTK